MQAKLRLHAAPATFVSLAVILALAAAGIVASSSASTARSRGPRTRGSAEAAKQLHCGDTITTDTTLHKNLVNCPNNGIVIGADGITLDLNGHTIDGDGRPFAGCGHSEICDSGVLATRHDHVIVKDGRVREFSVGANLGVTRHARVLGISGVRNQGQGIILYKATRSLVRNSSGNRNSVPGEFIGSGLSVYYGRRNRILDNSFRHNRDHGIFVYKSIHNLIKGNLTSSNNGEGGIVLRTSDRNRVRRNRSVRDGTGVFLPDGSSRNVIAHNRIAHPIQGDGQGIEIPAGDHNVIAHNSIRDTVQEGILVAGDEGVGNVVRRNHIRDAGQTGIHVGAGAKSKRGSNKNMVRRNHIRGAGADGVDVEARAKHTRLERNHAFGAKDDGLDANSPTTKLTRNEARRNGDLGIEAVHGVIDGGGNKASGNGDPRQCTHIVGN